MKRYILNSSKKIIGEIEFFPNKIKINNYKKPLLEIVDSEILESISKGENEETIQKFYDEYTLCIGEVACIYNISYTRANKWFKSLPLKTSAKAGRRNSSYGKKFSEQRIFNMVHNRKDDHQQRKGCTIPLEQRKQISQTLKRKYASGELKINKEKHSLAWERGAYENVDFGHGIGGHITSIKIQKCFFFRSLLELYYILYLEQNPNVTTYTYEKIKIPCDDKSIYTPDFLVNKTDIVELKSKKYIYNNQKMLEKFLYKKEQAQKYCNSHSLNYKVIFDEDIGFETRKMKTFLKNHPEIIRQFHITFIKPERVFGQ